MANSTVAEGLEMGQPTEDGKIEFTAENFDQLPNGQVISKTFNYNGDSWKLNVRICGCKNAIVDVMVRLELINKTSVEDIKAQIYCQADPKQLCYRDMFENSGDSMDAIVSFGRCVPVKDFKLRIQLIKDDDECDVESETSTDESSETPELPLISDVLKWFQSDHFGDVTIVAADGKKFRCHRDILALRCVVFRQEFNSSMMSRGKGLQIKNFDGEIVAALLQFVYTDQCHVGSIGDRLYAAADHYKLDRLKVLCETAMPANLSAETVVKTFRLAKFYHVDDLMAKCVDFADRHKAELPVGDLLADALKVGAEPKTKRAKSE